MPPSTQTLAPHSPPHPRHAHSPYRDAVRFDHSPLADNEPRAPPGRPRSAVPSGFDTAPINVAQGEDPLGLPSDSTAFRPPPLPPRDLASEPSTQPRRSPRAPPLPNAPSPDVATPFPPSKPFAPPLPNKPSPAVNHPFPLMAPSGKAAPSVRHDYVDAFPANSSAYSSTPTAGQGFTPLAPLPANAKPTFTAPQPQDQLNTSSPGQSDLRNSQGQVHDPLASHSL